MKSLLTLGLVLSVSCAASNPGAMQKASNLRDALPKGPDGNLIILCESGDDYRDEQSTDPYEVYRMNCTAGSYSGPAVTVIVRD